MFKKYLQAAVAALLLFSLLFLSSCGDGEIVKEGIDLLPPDGDGYSEQTAARARGVISQLLTLHYTADNGIAPDGAATVVISEAAEKIRTATLDGSVSESAYLCFISALERRGEELVGLMLSLSDGKGSVDTAALRSLYADISSDISGEYSGRVLYHVCLYVYDYKYEKQMALYAEEGYPHLKIKAESLKAEREIFTLEVGEQNCARAVQFFMIVSDLFFGGAFEDEALGAFSDEELLLLLSYTDISEVNMSSRGWSLLLSYLTKLLSFKEAGYYPTLLKYAVGIGDGETVGNVMNDAVALVSSVKERMSAADLSHLRRGDTAGFVSSASASFREEDWARLERIVSIDIDKPRYHAYVAEKYGEDYINYAASVGKISLQELRSAAGTDGFSVALEEYIAGKSPVLSYGVKR